MAVGWTLGASGASCTATCAAVPGHTCDPEANYARLGEVDEQQELVALLTARARAQTCASDVPGVYGDAFDGAAGFAEAVGVVCSGDCYRMAARWSSVALAHGDVVLADAAACRALCAATSACEVFTFDEDSACWLMRRLSPGVAPAITSMAGSNASDTTCVVEERGSGATRDYGTTSLACCASWGQPKSKS